MEQYRGSDSDKQDGGPRSSGEGGGAPEGAAAATHGGGEGRTAGGAAVPTSAQQQDRPFHQQLAQQLKMAQVGCSYGTLGFKLHLKLGRCCAGLKWCKALVGSSTRAYRAACYSTLKLTLIPIALRACGDLSVKCWVIPGAPGAGRPPCVY